MFFVLSIPSPLTIYSKVSITDLHMNEPQFYQQVIFNPSLQEVLLEEFNALEANHTWDIVLLHSNKKVIPYKWVYKIKHRSDGIVERYKAMVVIRDDTQKEGIDYHEIISPVVKLTTVKLSRLNFESHEDTYFNPLVDQWNRSLK